MFLNGQSIIGLHSARKAGERGGWYRFGAKAGVSRAELLSNRSTGEDDAGETVEEMEIPSSPSSYPPSNLFKTPPSQFRFRYAVIGAGFAGLSVAWHLLQSGFTLCPYIIDGPDISTKDPSSFDIVPRILACALMYMMNLALLAVHLGLLEDFFILTHQKTPLAMFIDCRGILRPASDMKNADILKENAQNCLKSCQIEGIHTDAAQKLVPHLHMPVDYAVYLPLALNVNPNDYLQALFLACQNLVDNLSASGYDGKEIHLHKRCINSLLELEDSESFKFIRPFVLMITMIVLSDVSLEEMKNFGRLSAYASKIVCMPMPI
ncbi:hypothetical protein ACLOJK_012939 [Asimina triloba]